MTFAEACIDWMGAHRIAVAFGACGTHEIPGTGELVLGGTVHPATADDEALWEGLVEALLYPRTVKHGDQAEGLLRLYADSGYFDLSGKKPEDFAAQAPAFSRRA